MIGALRATFRLLRPRERTEALLLVLTLGLSAVVELASVAAIYPFLAVLADPTLVSSDARIAALHSLLGQPEPTRFLLLLGAIVLGLTIAANALVAMTVWWQVRFVWAANHSISERIFARHLARPYADFLANNTSVYAKQILDETQTLVVNTLDPALTMIGRLTVTVLIGLLLVIVSPVATVAFVAVMGGGFALVYLRLRQRLKESGATSLAANKDRFQSVAETFGAIKQVKVGGLESLFHARYVPHSLAYSSSQSTHNVVRRVPYYLMQTVAFGGMTLLLMALLALGYDLRYILPVVGVLAAGGFRLLPAFQQILAAIVALRFTEPILRSLDAELARTAPAAEGTAGGRIVPTRSIELEGMSFTYPGSPKPTLANIDVSVPAGSSVAFVGPTGAGKSTLVDIFMGLLPPSRGRVVIDGDPLVPERLPLWQRSIGYVPQEIYLTDDTIAANIAFGVPPGAVDRGAVERAAQVAQIHDFITADLPLGYETKVGERGVRLSGGQRQRIGIARALYHDPPVLVLDEATSDVDTRTELDIARALDALSGTKTLVVIAHRLATAQRCDRIYLLEAGRVVASGTYDDLLRTSPGFRALALESPAAP